MGERRSSSRSCSVCPLCRMVIDSKGPCTDRSRCLAAVTRRAMLLWPQPCGPHGRLYIGVSLADPLFVEVELWLHGRHSSHLSCRRESPRATLHVASVGRLAALRRLRSSLVDRYAPLKSSWRKRQDPKLFRGDGLETTLPRSVDT